VALEALIAELPTAQLEEWRGSVAQAASASLRGGLGSGETASIEEGVRAMEAALRRHRLRG
jgi:hypothetical protein